MKIDLAYGRTGISVDLPDTLDIHVINKNDLPVLPDQQAAVWDALAAPIGCAPLQSLARGRASACILICDVTRPVPNHLFLGPMIRQLLAAGVPAAGITVLVATGLHRPNEGAELRELIGDDWVLETVRVENHFARDSSAHVDLGRTRTRGTPVLLDRRFVEADLRIATGLVEPHFMAGYSGGRKVVAPGIAHERTIRTFHTARFMEDPAATQCNLEGNPLHEEQAEIIRMLGDVYGLNTVLDGERRLIHVNFGEIMASHLKAVAVARAACTVAVDRHFNTVLTSAAGYPLDRTYYQTVKGMVTPMDIMAQGASLIIASDCSEGLGSAEYRQAQQRLIEQGPGAFIEAILTRDLAAIDEWQSEMQTKSMRRGEITLYSEGLPEADASLTGIGRTRSLADAVMASVTRSGDRSVAVIPEGPYVIPQYLPAPAS